MEQDRPLFHPDHKYMIYETAFQNIAKALLYGATFHIKSRVEEEK